MSSHSTSRSLVLGGLCPLPLRSRVVWVLLAASLLVGCDNQPSAMPQGPSAMKVQVVQLRSGEGSNTAELVGRIVARDLVLIHAQHDGLRVERVYVDAGQTVSAGQPLVKLDERSLRSERLQAEQQRRQARAEAASAQAEKLRADSLLRTAEDEARRFEQLAGSGAISEIESQQRRAQLEQAQAESKASAENLEAAVAAVEATELQLKLAGERERDGIVRAPVTGVISERSIEAGTIVGSTSGPLFKLARSRDRELEVLIDSTQLAGMREGDAVDIEVAPTGKSVPLRVRGHVRTIDSALADDSRRGRVRIAFQEVWPFSAASPALGSTATATLLHAPISGLPLPATALQFDPQPWVFVVDSNKRVAKQHVALSEDGAVVLKGLNAGDTVVRAAGALLSPGQLIEPVLPKGPGTSREELKK